ncbi:hypothetical protein Ddye_022068 [Dipteronia dyeriana]|uniref:Xylanase inhibitor C-terminal domain-containing protein n=1 Tax=Dipteronia dyeriana TaxID=168575 RepID=A0AAD9U3H6_9ROSI|nr:hypothetical protein Ddye_022068 [Dipteronia dyeriana]
MSLPIISLSDVQTIRNIFQDFILEFLGFGQGRYSYPTQVGATKFSFCLVSYTSDSVSSVFLHELPEPDDESTIVIRILENPRAPSFYYVGLREIRIADDVIPISPEEWKFDADGRGGIFIDSSSIVTRFPEDIYSTFRDKFMGEVGGLPHLPGEGAGAMDTCFHVPSKERLTEAGMGSIA